MTNQELIDDRYQIIRKIGQGGFSEVFLAIDQRLNRKVAIKRLNLLLLDATDRERFLREARIIANMRHRHIIIIYSLEEMNDHLHIVMEYADQGNLLDCITASQGGLSITDTIDVGIAMCKALAVVHANGIIHRDVKPHNILMVTEEGEGKPVPKLADFGIARDVTRTTLTPTNQPIGTLAYMPPEAILGEEGETDERRDIYGLGATLYEALTKHVPLGYELGEITRRLGRRPTAPRRFRSDLPAWLERVTLRALAPNRGHRYSTMNQMLADLEQQQTTRKFLTTSRRWRILEQAIANVLGNLIWWIMGTVVAGLLISFGLWGPTLLGRGTPTPTTTATESLVVSPTHTATITPTLTTSPISTPRATSTRAPTLTPSPTPTSPPLPTATPTPLPTATPTPPPRPPPPPPTTEVKPTPTPR